MNARHYRTEYNLSPLDFPAIEGLGESKIDFRTEPPFIVDNKVRLKITKKYVLIEFHTRKEYEVLSAVSVYEIPLNDIKSRDTIYDCYKDATQGLNEAFEYAKKQLPLPNITFPTPTIDIYKQEIDGVFYLLNTLN